MGYCGAPWEGAGKITLTMTRELIESIIMPRTKKIRKKKLQSRIHQTLTVHPVKPAYTALTTQFHKSVQSQRRQLNITNGEFYETPSDWAPPRG
jgi:hypothetical protein